MTNSLYAFGSDPEVLLTIPAVPLYILLAVAGVLLTTAGVIALKRKPVWALALPIVATINYALAFSSERVYLVWLFLILPTQVAYICWMLKIFYSDNKRLSKTFKLLSYGLLLSIAFSSVAMIYVGFSR